MAQTSNTQTSQNIFHLSRFKKDCHYEPVHVDFNPIRRMNNVYKKVIPSYNFDQKHYTSAFATEYEQFRISSQCQRNDSTEKEYFQRRVQENLSKPEMLTPFFNTEGISYCSICSKHFQSYWEHINLPTHIKRIKNSKANSYIHELTEELHHGEEGSDNQKTKDHENKSRKIKKEKKKKVKEEKEKIRNEDLIIKWPQEVMTYLSEERKAFHITSSLNNVGEAQQKN